MGDILSISLAETNRIRASFGLKPIPEGQNERNKVQQTEKGKEGQHDSANVVSQSNNVSSNNNSNYELNSYKSFELKKKIAKMRQENTYSQEVEDDSENWLSMIGDQSVSKKDQKAAAIQSLQEPSFKVSEDLRNEITSKPMILTLKESQIDASDEEQNALHNETISHEKEDAKNIKLKELNRERQLKKISLSSIGQYYDEDEDDGKVNNVSLNINNFGIMNFTDEANSVTKSNDLLYGKRRIEFESDLDNDEPESDFAPVKIKKRKKKDLRSKPKVIDRSKMVKVDIFDEDMEDETEPVLKIKTKVKHISEPLEETVQDSLDMEALEEKARKTNSVHFRNTGKNMLILDENDEFLDSIKTDILENTEDHTIKIDLKNQISLSPTSSSKTSKHTFIEKQPASVDFSTGIAGTLNFLKERNIIKPPQDSSVESIKKTKILAEQELRLAQIKSHLAPKLKTTQASLLKEHDLHNLKEHEKQKIVSEINELQRKKLQNYNPEIQLTYKDSNGNELTTKEAYKLISQAWHGTKSNSKKIAKQQKKIDERKRQVEKDHFLGL